MGRAFKAGVLGGCAALLLGSCGGGAPTSGDASAEAESADGGTPDAASGAESTSDAASDPDADSASDAYFIYDDRSRCDNCANLSSTGERTLRGGTWLGYDYSLRAANRGPGTAAAHNHFTGFRCARRATDS